MVQPAKNSMRNNVSEPLNLASAGRVLSQRNVNTPFIIIAGVFRKNSPEVLGVEHDQMISAPRRIDPINLSAKQFCQGERNEVGQSRMPIARTRALNAIPNARSLSRMRYLGAIPRKRFSDLVCPPSDCGSPQSATVAAGRTYNTDTHQTGRAHRSSFQKRHPNRTLALPHILGLQKL